MEPLRKLLIKELTPELHKNRWELTHRRLANFKNENAPLVLLDPKVYQREEDLDGDKAIANAKELAVFLGSIDAQNELGLLKCMGWFEEERKAQLYFVFYAPPGCTPDTTVVTLQDYLFQTFRPSLTERVALAVSLANQIAHIHRQGYYHKGLRNENVAFFRHAQDARSLTRPYLIGFDFSRKAEMGKWSEKVKDTHACMFLHPDAIRNPNKNFTFIYDYYALGILLVEIAYWQPIEQVLHEHEIFQKKECREQDALEIRGILLNESAEQDEDYIRELAFRAGETYAELTALCLEGSFGRSSNPDILVAAFKDRVVERLQNCII